MEKYIYRGKLDRVVDGDTIDAMIDVGFDIWVFKRIRFVGMDAWESRTSRSLVGSRSRPGNPG